ncbi:protein mono-ADP-ribosyltransferase PARP6-like [Mytilus californianus]|uniref:protein mono-ADP-ribosyltransferase PARP6-like n=1 Tax=Mytilus californianus TaxID=6549 RepID=UPI002247ED99|nr:protein mono-ADP-ribosyltransferase PARP6-like [Mytilus californianus]
MSLSARKQKFVEDAKAAEELCNTNSLPFGDFSISESTISFAVTLETPRFEKCTICVTDDYPENTFICKFGEKEETEIINSTIPLIIVKLHNDLTSPPDMMSQSSLSVPHSTQRSISMESSGSSYMDCKSTVSSESEEEDMDYYYKEEGCVGQKICPVLEKDMEKLVELYGEAAISYRLLDAIDEIDIQINLPLSSIIDAPVAEAWKLNKEEPLSVCLHLSYTNYLDIPSPPKVEVFQTSRNEKNGISSQMKKVMETFVFHQWPKNSNRMIDEYHKRHEIVVNQVSDEEAASMIEDKDLARIMEIGFSAEQARDALILSRGDFLEAINHLFANKDSLQTETKTTKKEDKKVRDLKTTERQSSVPNENRKKKNIFRQISHGSAGSRKSNELSLTADLHLKPSSTWFGKNSKRIPEPEFGFLVQIFQYSRQRLPTLNEYCVVCDEPHVFQNGAMLKPAVCSRELCIFAFQTLGVMSDAAEDIATGAEVVDLLLTMTKAASKHNRRNIIFDPYPTVVDPSDPNELALNPKSKDYDAVDKILKHVMSMEQMTALSSSDIKKTLDSKNKLCYPLLQWIITSNRSHIVKLTPEKRIPFMKTPFQYLLLSSPPAKEAAFREAKEKYGSTFAFHGSAVENWHSIIRQGLIVASGTNKQVNGAAYGKGIYLSPNAGTSFGYSRMYAGGGGKKQSENRSDRFLRGDNNTLFCIALCEVITWPQLKKSGQIWVCPESDYVCTRFFFVYEEATGHENIDTQQKQYEEAILKALR